MKRITIIAFTLIGFAQAQDSTAIRQTKNQINKFKIWYNGQQLDAENLDVICVEDDFSTFANLRYNLSDSTGKMLASGFLKMDGAQYRQYITKPNHGDFATTWVMQQLNLTARPVVLKK